MKNKKRIALGTLSAVTALAAPIATVISCGSDKEAETHWFDYESKEGDGMGRNFVISPEQNDPNINQLMTKHNGKWKFKEASQIPDSNLVGVGTIRLNIFLNDHVRQELNIARKEMIKKYGNTKREGTINITPSQDGNPEFFEKFTSSLDEAKKLNAKIERLEKTTEFRLAFNLIIPKWWKTDFGDDSVTFHMINHSFEGPSPDSRRYFYDQIESVTAEDPSTKITWISIQGIGIRHFDGQHLPSSLKRLRLGFNQLKSFDATKLPSKILELGLNSNKLTSLDTSKLPKSLRDIDVSINELTSLDTSNLPKSLTSFKVNGNKFPKELAIKLESLSDKIHERLE